MNISTQNSKTKPFLFVGRENELKVLEKALIENKSRVAAITGVGGIGKTTLAKQFAMESAHFFPDGVTFLGPNSTHRTLEELGLGKNDAVEIANLFILDQADDYKEEALAHLFDIIFMWFPKSQILVTSRKNVPQSSIEIELDPLRQDHLQGMWMWNGWEFNQREAEMLYQAVGGHPLAGIITAQLVKSGQYTIEEVCRFLSEFSQPGLVSPDGRPLTRGSKEEIDLVSGIVIASEDILRYLETHPHAIYDLSSREFEELVAELLVRQGYKVEMTPISKDGGKDLYVAHRTALGSLLYIVECKKYSPQNPVGIGIVRQLYGVVQAEKVNGGIIATTSHFTKGAIKFGNELSYQLKLHDYFSIQKWLRIALHQK